MLNNNLITGQKAFWNKASIGWKKWNRFIMDCHEPIGKRILELANNKPSDKILDIGTGAGEPGMSAASVRLWTKKIIMIFINSQECYYYKN